MKKNWCFILIQISYLCAAGILLGVILWQIVIRGTSMNSAFLFLIVLMISPWYLFRQINYTFDDENFIQRVGPFRIAIPFENIKEVCRDSDFISFPANRINIKYFTKFIKYKYISSGSIFLSAQDTDAFLRILKERCPHANIT